MIVPDKIITDNPFVDNVLYYAKLLALNSIIKDEEEALKRETKESLMAGEILISCVERTATYEVFESIPRVILEKYITPRSNLDAYVDSPQALNTYLKTMPEHERVELFHKISSLARDIYIDHYETMSHYIINADDNWLDVKRPLYNKCVAKTATYIDLFSELPYLTRKRIVKQYLNNYDATDLDTILDTLSNFRAYVSSRADTNITTELNNISSAMRSVFASHYEIMQDREYFSHDSDDWLNYIIIDSVYKRCKDSTATYKDLYKLFPPIVLLSELNDAIGSTNVALFDLTESLETLERYFEDYSTDPDQEKDALNKSMRQKYIAAYNPMMDRVIYELCKSYDGSDLTIARIPRDVMVIDGTIIYSTTELAEYNAAHNTFYLWEPIPSEDVAVSGRIDYWTLKDYMPKETLKMILATFIEEVTNLEAYSRNKSTLNQYLNTLPKAERDEIKLNIKNDMLDWYPANHLEKNPYYRAFIGQPPIDENGYIFEDTLYHTYDSSTKSFIEFGDIFVDSIPTDDYPISHWNQPICDFDDYDIAILQEYGVLDSYISACKSRNVNDIPGRYNYFKFLGDDKLDLYTCRKADNFQLIGVPTIEDTDIKNKFIDTYATNRDYIIRTVYSDAYKFQSEFYNKFVIIFIVLNTIMDLLTDIPEYIIDREVFDARCVRFIFESYGIPYYSEIPIKYQKAMLKNLNLLIKFKSSTRNMIDICSLFGFEDVRVFHYYLFKSRVIDESTGQYIFNENNDISYDIDELYIRDNTGKYKDFNGVRFSKLTDYRKYDPTYHTKEIKVQTDSGIETRTIMNNYIDYYVQDPDDTMNFVRIRDLDYFTKIKADTRSAELKFIRVPAGESVVDYKNDPDAIVPYDEVVTQDEGNTWDGGLVHEELKERILDYEFNAVRTKYISIETVTKMSELAFQVSYFYNMLFDNFYSEDNLTVEIPFIKLGHKFRFMDVICYMFALMYIYNGLEDNIMYSPTQILYVKGYNFRDALNEVMNDPIFFQQEDPKKGTPLADDEKYNIFDINERIAEDDYKYQEAFKNFKITAFNLGVDIDELEKWLNDECQMSLDDFIVDDTLTKFNQVITLRQFFSLNNSYYQRDILRLNLEPLPFNQVIKYGFDYRLLRKTNIGDASSIMHNFVNINGVVTEAIDQIAPIELYIVDYQLYVTTRYDYAIYYQYKLEDGVYIKQSDNVYIPVGEEYKRLFDDYIRTRDDRNRITFSTDTLYRKTEEGYEEIVLPNLCISDDIEDGKKLLNWYKYYEFSNGAWRLKPDNCYIKVMYGSTPQYVLESEAGGVNATQTISEDDCFIRHSDGHFIKLSDTDYYIRTHNMMENAEQYVLHEEDYFILSPTPTEYYDPTDNPRIYYTKLSTVEGSSSDDTVVIITEYYVKDDDGNIVPESELIHPLNCYYKNTSGGYQLVYSALAIYKSYSDFPVAEGLLVLQNNYDYIHYDRIDDSYYESSDDGRKYVYNSDDKYVLAIINDATYDDENLMIVVFNKYVDAARTGNSDEDDIESGIYNAEVTDKIWDENDWQYESPSANPDIAIGMNGENKWYYKKPGVTVTPVVDDNTQESLVGSGWYLESSAYIGDVKLNLGERYYMAFDIECNFNGKIQISCESDDSCNNITDRVYRVHPETIVHVNQIFTCNAVEHPTLRFLIYYYDEYPIHIGDYIVIKNLSFAKSYSDNFIARDITSFEKLQELYRTNEAIYNYLTKLMTDTSDYDKYVIYKKLYDSIMFAEYNKEAFKISDNKYAKTYTEFLENRDAVLFERLNHLKSLDLEAMQKEVADNIIEVTYAIDEFSDMYSYGYLYSYFPAVSANFIQQYIAKIINFFKSWKVHLLGISTVYKFDSEFENIVKILYDPNYYNVCHVDGNVTVYDGIKINPIDARDEYGQKYTDKYPDLVLYTNFIDDDCRPHDRVRVISRAENLIRYTDNYEDMHIIFASDNHIPKDEDGNLVITSESAGFTVIDENHLLMSDDEDEQKSYVSQVIGEVNHFSKDILSGGDD